MQITKDKLFILGNLSFIGGIALSSIMPAGYLLLKFWFFSALLFFILNVIIFWKNKKIVTVAILATVFFFGIWRYTISWPTGLDNDALLIKERSYIGQVIKESDIRANNQKLTLEVEDENGLTPIGHVLITTNLYPEFNYGELISFDCQLTRPEPFEGFAYDRYLAKDNIYWVCYYPEIKKIGQGKINSVMNLIYKIKNSTRQRINKGLTEPAAGLTKAIILGDKREINDDLREKFSRTGLSHIVAISGMHISILILMLMWFLIYVGLSRRNSFYFVIIFLVLYIILVGMPASALRAGLMGFLLLLAWQLGRLNKISSSLLLAGSIMLLHNPKLLTDDVGWQLSFLAVWGIIWFYPLLKKIWKKFSWPRLFGIRDILLVSLSVQIMIWPVLSYHFSFFSIVSILANVLVIWLLPLIFGFGVFAILGSMIMSGLEDILFLPLEFLFSYLLAVVNILSPLPFGVVVIDNFSSFWLLAYYIAVVILYLKTNKI